MRIPKVLLTYIGCVFDAFLCVLADLSEHVHTVPDFFRRKSPEHIVCKLFLSADFVNTFLCPEGNFFASGKENKYTNSHSCI